MLHIFKVTLIVMLETWIVMAYKPNIIFFMADDLGWNDIGIHGSEIWTPNIDRLMTNGLELRQYYTSPMCGPSRMQLLSGRYLTRMGRQHKNLTPCRPSGLPLEEETIADVLKPYGYKSHMIGKWHAGFYTEKHLPTNRGFDSFYGAYNGQSDHYFHTTSYKGYPYLDWFNNTEPNFNSANYYSTYDVEDRAAQIIDTHKKEDGLFMFLSYQSPHAPLQAPVNYTRLYQHIKNEKRRNFAAMVTALDHSIGRIIEYLKVRGLYDNTVIVFSSDNGGQALRGASNYPLRGNKGTYYEGGVRAVAGVSGPLIKQKVVSHDLFHITDWLPTFLHLASNGSEIQYDLDGVNQWETISKGVPSARQEIIYNIDPLDLYNIKSRKRNRKNHRNRDRKNRQLLRFQQGRLRFKRNTLNQRSALTSLDQTTTLNENQTRGQIIDSISNHSFDVMQLSAIRSGPWKLLTGYHGFNQIIPNPVTELLEYEQFVRTRNDVPPIQLFNIVEDPMESFNKAQTSPEIVKSLLDRLYEHSLTAKEPFYPPSHAGCDPELNFGVWGPYIELTDETRSEQFNRSFLQ